MGGAGDDQHAQQPLSQPSRLGAVGARPRHVRGAKPARAGPVTSGRARLHRRRGVGRARERSDHIRQVGRQPPPFGRLLARPAGVAPRRNLSPFHARRLRRVAAPHNAVSGRALGELQRRRRPLRRRHARVFAPDLDVGQYGRAGARQDPVGHLAGLSDVCHGCTHQRRPEPPDVAVNDAQDALPRLHQWQLWAGTGPDARQRSRQGGFAAPHRAAASAGTDRKRRDAASAVESVR
mmetsp:Transcript_15697/g.54507  ORF Transcript_15697/g.54507 Transcript_15697/m.54507 type:complete len:236 (+) Transcript_15697:212-919(+)